MIFIESLLPSTAASGSALLSITIVNERKKRATDFTLGIILHLNTVIRIDIISFCLGKRDTGNSPLYPIIGFRIIII